MQQLCTEELKLSRNMYIRIEIYFICTESNVPNAAEQKISTNNEYHSHINNS